MTGLGLVLCPTVLYVFLKRLRICRGGGKPDSHHAEVGGRLDFPIYECYRGFFQRDEQPETLCYVVAEQVIRVIWMLLATFFIMNGGLVTAVNRPLPALWGWWRTGGFRFISCPRRFA